MSRDPTTGRIIRACDSEATLADTYVYEQCENVTGRTVLLLTRADRGRKRQFHFFVGGGVYYDILRGRKFLARGVSIPVVWRSGGRLATTLVATRRPIWILWQVLRKYQPSNAAPPAKSKMAARGPQNGRAGLERCLHLGFWAF